MSVEAPPAPPKADPRPPTAKADVAEFMQKMRAKNPATPPAEPAKPDAEPAKPAPVAAKPPEPTAITEAPKPAEPKSLVPEIPQEPLVKAPEPPSLEEAKRLKRSDYAALEAARDDFKTKWETSSKTLSELQKKLEEASSRTAPELEEARKEIAELRAHRDQFNLERSPEFKKAFDAKIETAILDAKEAVGSANAEKLEKILRAPAGEARDERIKEFAKELEDDFEKGMVRDAYSRLKSVQRERESELARARENVKALDVLESKKAEERVVQMKQQRERLYAATLADATRSLPEFIEGEDASHNAQVVENRLLLQDMIQGELSPQEYGRMAAWAIRGHRSLAREQAMTAEISKLRGEIARLTQASPGLDGGVAATGDPNGKMPQNRTQLLEWASKRMVGASAKKSAE